MTKKNENRKSFQFRGKLGISGVMGGDTYPYWEVSEEVYRQVTNTEDLSYTDRTENGKCKLYLNQLVPYEHNGKKQKVRIVIETEE